MSRRRKTKAKKERQLEPEEVLDGSAEYKVEDLFDLIHRVNPTRQRISKQQQIRRYALKNRLQSLLIRRLGDDHLKVAPTEQGGVVSLEQVSGLRDACHAIAAELEPDARSWVRRQLDLAARGDEAEFSLPGFDPADAAAGAAGEVEELLERGRQALEEYDYERGEELLRRAFEESRRPSGEAVNAVNALNAAAAAALLELQVDLLGMDAAALELEPRLSPAVKRRPAIRTLLALAAARAGDVERALELVAGLTGAVAGVSLPRAAEVYAALTSRAIRDRDSRSARQYLERVAELDPSHAAIPALETEIAGLRAEELSDVEAELERRFRELGAAAVESQARALADRWPEGEVARRILRRAAAERREAESAELLELGEQARRAERYDDAARHFQAALDAGSERPDLPALAADLPARAADLPARAADLPARAADLPARAADLPALIAELTELAREERERSAVDDVLGRLAAAGMSRSPPSGVTAADRRRDALLAYLSLAEELRSRVRSEADLPALGWLDEITPPRAGAKAQAAVTAVLTLEHAVAALERGEAEEAAGLIEPHRALLGRVARARSLGLEARRQIAADRRRRAEGTLAAAVEAFDQGRPGDARRHLAAVSRGDLEAGDQARVQDLQARIDGVSALERLAHEHDERRLAGDLTGALARARQLAEAAGEAQAPGDDAAGAHRRWSENVEEIQDRIRRAWRLEVVPEPVAPDGRKLSLAEAVQPAKWLEKSVTWLDDDGRELVLANAWGRWLFIDLVDVARDRITARVSLRAPGVLLRPLLTYRDGDRLWITSRNGDVLEIACDGWRILGFYPVRELLFGERHVDRARPMPGGRWLWLQVTDWGLDEICLVDLREWRLGRKLPPDGGQWVMIPGDDPRMLVSGEHFAARVYTAAGELASSEPLVLSPAPLRGRVPFASLRGRVPFAPLRGRVPFAPLRGRVPFAPLRGDSQESVLDADLGPDGRGLLLLLSEPLSAADDDDEAGGLREKRRSLARFSETSDGALRLAARHELESAHRLYALHAVVTSAERCLSFVLIYTRDDDKELLVFSGDGPADRLEPLARSRWPSQTTLVHDRRGRHVAAMTDPSGLRLQFLDARAAPPAGAHQVKAAPETRRQASYPTYKIYPATCSWSTSGTREQELAAELEKQGVGSLRTHFARVESDATQSVDDKLLVALAVRRSGHARDLSDAIEGFARRMVGKHPGHAGLVLLLADIEAVAENWQEVSRLMRRTDPAGLDARRARHFRHLEGMAHLHGGRLDDAHEAFRRGMAHEGQCIIEPLMHLTQPMTEPPSADEWAADQPAIRRLSGAVRTADHALAAGDPAAARAALERRDLKWLQELQSAARRASVYLARPAGDSAEDAGERFDERVALAFYAQIRQDEEEYTRHNLFLPELSWDEERLAELEERVLARLEELGGA